MKKKYPKMKSERKISSIIYGRRFFKGFTFEFCIKIDLVCKQFTVKVANLYGRNLEQGCELMFA